MAAVLMLLAVLAGGCAAPSAWQQGEAALQAGRWEEAEAVFARLHETGEPGAYLRWQEARFARAQADMAQERWADALYTLELLVEEDFAPAEEPLRVCCYHMGLRAGTRGQWTAAREWFTWAVPYADSASRAAALDEFCAAQDAQAAIMLDSAEGFIIQ